MYCFYFVRVALHMPNLHNEKRVNTGLRWRLALGPTTPGRTIEIVLARHDYRKKFSAVYRTSTISRCLKGGTSYQMYWQFVLS